MQLKEFSEVTEVLRAGIYALAFKGIVVYVGKSKCMLSRVEAHRGLFRRKAPSWMPIKGVQFDQVFVRPCPLAMLDALEAEMINRYKPKINQRLKTTKPIETETPITINGVALLLNRKVGIERRL